MTAPQDRRTATRLAASRETFPFDLAVEIELQYGKRYADAMVFLQSVKSNMTQSWVSVSSAATGEVRPTIARNDSSKH
jgi:hypothetical protein